MDGGITVRGTTTEELLELGSVPAPSLDVAWRKSRYSNSQGNCVRLAKLPGGGIAMSDSKDPDGPALVFPDDAIRSFFLDIRAGGLDDLM